MSDYVREFEEVIQPVRDAIDRAFQSGRVDPEMVMEAVESHVNWWQEEIAAGLGCPCVGTPDQEDCPHA